MEAEEESPHYVAAPSTNDSGGAAGEPKRTSSRNWGQHWQDLDRDYFRPVSAADIENLRTQVWWLDGGCWMGARKSACMACAMGLDRLPPHTQLQSVEQMMVESEASSLFKTLDASSSSVEGQIASAKAQQHGAREEEQGLLPRSQEEAEEEDASSVRSHPATRPQSQCPHSDSSASTSSCSVSDKENKAKR
jgi:hypothetical protein